MQMLSGLFSRSRSLLTLSLSRTVFLHCGQQLQVAVACCQAAQKYSQKIYITCNVLLRLSPAKLLLVEAATRTLSHSLSISFHLSLFGFVECLAYFSYFN